MMVVNHFVETLYHPLDVLVATRGQATATVILAMVTFAVALTVLGALWAAIVDLLRVQARQADRKAYVGRHDAEILSLRASYAVVPVGGEW